MFQKEIQKPILALFFISLGGLLLHTRIHPPGAEVSHLIPLLIGLVTTFVLPFLFNKKSTVAIAFILNFAAVIIGTITMLYFSATHWRGPVTLWTLIINSTLADIFILSAKIPLAYEILRYFRPKS